MTMLDDAGGAAATEAAGLPAVLEPRALVPAEVFATGGVRALLDKIEREVRAVRTDISTPAGRDQVRSLAYKVARSKTALDAMGKGLTDEWRARTDAVNAERRAIRDRLDALAEQVRKPLTEWEDAEKARVAGHERALAEMVEAPGYGATETAAELELRLSYLRSYPARDWREFAQRAADTLAAEIERTERLLAAARKREAEAAELARLRAEEAERARQEAARLQAEREARIAAEAAERAQRQAEERAAHAARAAAEQAEAERRAAEKQRREAEERAARAEAAAAEAERRAEAERIAAAERAERDRAAAVEAERRRVAQAEEAARQAEAARAADRAHRGRINKAAADALVALGLTDEQARLVVTAIVAGGVPAISIRY